MREVAGVSFTMMHLSMTNFVYKFRWYCAHEGDSAMDCQYFQLDEAVMLN